METKRIKRLPQYIQTVDDLFTQDDIKNCIENHVLKGLPSIDALIIIKRNIEGQIIMGVAGFEQIEVLGALEVAKNMILANHYNTEEIE